jgi:hypothetical protein
MILMLMKLCRVALVGAIFGGFFVVLVMVSLNIKTEKKTVIAVSAMDSQTVAVRSEQVLNEEKNLSVSFKATTGDARPLLIRRYLEKYKSPLAPYSDLIFELSQTYGFEYYWIVAIGQQESNLCKKIPEDSYNCWGYGIHKNGTLKFDSYELALKSYAEYLKRVYFDKGLNTPELIMKKYCPSSNGSWAYGVGHFIEEIENGY